jgi:hypothetical protein
MRMTKEVIKRPVARKRKHSEYEELLASVSSEITKRPKYVKGIGVLHGKRGITAWLKIKMTREGRYKGQIYPAGSYLEMKLGLLPSFTWEQLEDAQRAFQGKADRGEPLEDTQDVYKVGTEGMGVPS